MRPNQRFALAVLFVLAAPAGAETLIEARYWPADLGGRLQLESLENNEFFTDFDPIRDLGLDEDGAVEGRLLFRPGRWFAVRLAWLPLSFTGDAQVTGMIGGLEITPQVQSELNLDYARLGFAWQFLRAREGRFRLGPMVEAKGFQGDATIAVDNPIVPLVRDTDFEAGFAAAGLLLDIEASDRVEIYAEATTLIDTDEGDLTDTEVGIRVYVTRALALTAGYRQIEIDIEDGADLLEVDIDAALIGAAFRF